ncbi:hypothetical protein AB0H42_33080 [Nocardia sp. NPDC050799]|uniref:hypothetical protein n=1 Tax=Nocardia sp. NPDC050799 TaxID=3154842 RepID=UPI0033D9945D
MDPAAVERVTATARVQPESSTAITGFGDRAIGGLYPVVPAWIQWLSERNEATAGWVYQLCYPPIDAEGRIVGGLTPEKFWTRDRMYWAEKQARTVLRARRFHGRGVVFAHAPELEDDDAFYAAFAEDREWDGHWYSRDPIGAAGW